MYICVITHPTDRLVFPIQHRLPHNIFASSIPMDQQKPSQAPGYVRRLHCRTAHISFSSLSMSHYSSSTHAHCTCYQTCMILQIGSTHNYQTNARVPDCLKSVQDNFLYYVEDQLNMLVRLWSELVAAYFNSRMMLSTTYMNLQYTHCSTL